MHVVSRLGVMIWDLQWFLTKGALWLRGKKIRRRWDFYTGWSYAFLCFRNYASKIGPGCCLWLIDCLVRCWILLLWWMEWRIWLALQKMRFIHCHLRWLNALTSYFGAWLSTISLTRVDTWTIWLYYLISWAWDRTSPQWSARGADGWHVGSADHLEAKCALWVPFVAWTFFYKLFLYLIHRWQARQP